jgi:hypothetical protein
MNRYKEFGTTHLRLASIVGDTGFTIILVRSTGGHEGVPKGDEIVATGSLKDFGDDSLETYAQWSKNLSGTQWASRKRAKE